MRNEIQQRAETTLELATLSIFFAFAVGVPIGVYSALKQDKLPDVILRGLAIGWLSMPSFWVGTLLITFPAKWWGYATPVGYVHFWQDPLKNLEQLYLPAIALGLALSAILARFTRSAMLEELRQDYVRTARAKGLRERVVISRARAEERDGAGHHSPWAAAGVLPRRHRHSRVPVLASGPGDAPATRP